MTADLDGLATTTRRRPPRQRWPWVAATAAAAVVFALGVAFGQALEENQETGETRTSERTLVPETLPAETVTVTVSGP